MDTIIRKKILRAAFLISLFFLNNTSGAQTLWGVDLKDYETPKGWTEDRGIYVTDVNDVNIDAAQYIPTVGFVFYIEDPEITDLTSIYETLVNEFGKEDINKDYLDVNIRSKPIDRPATQESIGDGFSFIYREWKEDGLIIRLFWNQFRFWVEAVER